MSRNRGPSGPAVSLFPFLAVLLCTMGALLVVLVIFSRSAARTASGTDQAASEELEAASIALQSRIDELDRAKREALDHLSQARLRLAGIEDHARGLQDEMRSIQASMEALAPGKKSSQDDDHDAELSKRLADARIALERAQAEAGTKPAAYAVIPYEGSSGTRRRPLYIECCGDGVFLQPEGIRLKPGDFEGPPGPGNPLASALRAAREHLAARPGAAGTTEAQPYPLLLVRPSGVMAYYAAREAIGSWGSDFGYQLVDEDWQLAFPAADPALADVEQRAIDEARVRLQWLAEVRPKRPSRPAPKYRASTTRGGVVSTAGPSVLGDQSRFDWNDAAADRAAGSTGRSGSGFGSGNGDRSAGPVATSPLDRDEADRLVVGGAGRFGSGYGTDPQGGPIGSKGSGDRVDDRTGQGIGSAVPSGTRPGLSAEGSPSGSPNGMTAFGEAGGEATQLGAGPAGPGDPAAGTSGSSGGSSPQRGNAPASTTAGPGGGPTTGVAMPGLLQPQGQMQPQGQLQPQAGSSASAGASAGGSLAQSRGSNWASLASRDRPIPLNRPIQLECAAGEFRIYDDSNRRVVARIPIDGPTASAIDPLVKAVHDRVASWGIAGDRMYWKPQLFLSETPDGAGRRADLERLLADSGIETLRRGSTVSPLPAVTQTPAGTIRQAAAVQESANR